MARSKFTLEVQNHIVAAIEAGNYAEVAARGAGIGKSTFYEWLERGETGEQPYADFADAVKGAEAKSEMTAVEYVFAHMENNWQAAMTYLERRYSDRWKRRDRVDTTSAEPQKIVILTPGEADKV